MADPNFLILYVDDINRSAEFYSDLLGREPERFSSDFVMFILSGGLVLALESRAAAQPSTAVTGGGCELVFTLENEAAVDSLHAEWVGLGVLVEEAPVQKHFGYTFLARDPDGHRLRPFTPVRTAEPAARA